MKDTTTVIRNAVIRNNFKSCNEISSIHYYSLLQHDDKFISMVPLCCELNIKTENRIMYAWAKTVSHI